MKLDKEEKKTLIINTIKISQNIIYSYLPNTNIQVEYLPSFIEIKCVRWLTWNFKE